MKELKRKITITYRWWKDDKKVIKPEHVEALEETAMDRIQEQMGKGWACGDLTDNIHMADDPVGGVEYSGWWEVKKG